MFLYLSHCKRDTLWIQILLQMFVMNLFKPHNKIHTHIIRI